MNIQATTSHLQRKNQPFDVIIQKNGIDEELYTGCSPTNVEELLNEVVKNHSPEKLIIQERKKNGSVSVKQSKYEIEFGGMEAQLLSLSGIESSAPTPNNLHQVPADFKDYMINDLQTKNSKLETKNDRLETENYDLKKERDNLSLDIKTKDKEFELSLKERDLEQTNGLSGIMETVASNPAFSQIAALAVGRLMGVDPANMGAEQPVEAQEVEPVPSNAPEMNTKVAQYVTAWILKQEENTVKAYFQLMQHIAKDNSIITEILQELNNPE